MSATKPPVFIGMTRIRNEQSHIARCINSIIPLCDVVFVMDDHSTDKTREIVMGLPKTVYLQSPFYGLDESRDKNWLLETIIRTLPAVELNEDSPYWVLCIDGDEALEIPLGPELLRAETMPMSLAYSFKILYLWGDEQTVRTDGVYANFRRPSLFRLINPAFKFKTTPNGGNLHCSSIPQEFLGHAKVHGRNTIDDEGTVTFRDTCLLHYGYMEKAERARKFAWYNTVDPRNEVEDCYRHMIQGDGPVLVQDADDDIGVAAVAYEIGAGDRLKWAGPMKLEALVA